MGRIIRPKDRLGIPYEMDGKLYIDAVCAAAVTKGVPMLIAPGALGWALPEIDAESGDIVGGQTATPATLAVLQYIGIPEQDYAAKAIGKFCIGGSTKAMVNGTAAVTKGHYLEIINALAYLQEDGATRTVNACAVAEEAYAVAATALKSVFMLGIPVQIAAA